MELYNRRNKLVTTEEAATIRARAVRAKEPINIIDPIIDEEWARLFHESAAMNSYYDYFFSGQDIRAYIAELGEERLPIHSIGFRVEQQKAPVYGFASYTYDAVMRGTRLVNGQFILVTRYPGYMKDVLSKAASNRATRFTHGGIQDAYGGWSLTEDDANIERYWSRNIDLNTYKTGKSEWSAHPPFSLVIVYGIQETSVGGWNNQYNTFQSDMALFSDHNQRLVEGAGTTQDRFVIEACELTSVQHAIGSDGAAVMEAYEFFGRDIIIPSPRNAPHNNFTLGASNAARA